MGLRIVHPIGRGCPESRVQYSTMHPLGSVSPKDFRGLSHRILQCANSGVSRIDFLRETTKMLLDFSECDAVELRLKCKDICFRCKAAHQPRQPFAVEVARWKEKEQSPLFICSRDENALEELCQVLVEKQYVSSAPFFTKRGSFWTGNARDSLPRALGLDAAVGREAGDGGGNCPSLVVIPIVEESEVIGLVQLKSEKQDFFEEEEVESYENVAQALGLALVSQIAHTALRERVKELTCLYSLAQLAERPGITLAEILQGIVELLPPSWQYPEVTAARVLLDGASYVTPQFQESSQKQSADIVVNDELRGRIDVVYTQQRPDLDEGPFLKEERSLIDAVAGQVALVIERRQAAEEKTRLQDQLRHADCLATIGQLSAGVAHELNEPLGNILAFAQLAQKQAGLPGQAAQDLEKIVTTSLHAREIIKKLMLFARQMPPRKIRINLNNVVEEGLYFLESRCSKSGVALERCPSARVPPGKVCQVASGPSLLDWVRNASASRHRWLCTLQQGSSQSCPDFQPGCLAAIPGPVENRGPAGNRSRPGRTDASLFSVPARFRGRLGQAI